MDSIFPALGVLNEDATIPMELHPILVSAYCPKPLPKSQEGA